MSETERCKDPNICALAEHRHGSTDKSLQIVNHRIAPSFIMTPSNKNNRLYNLYKTTHV